MSQRVLFVCDALSGFATYKDTTFAMMRECQKRGIEIHAASLQELRAAADQSQARLQVFSHRIRIDQPEAQPWWIEDEASWKEATVFDVIIMRKDPPFDQNYFVATQLLEIAERQGVPVVNSPQALRNHGEKMAALEFPEFTPPTLISSNIQSIKAFAAHHEKIVIKPLDAMGGAGVFVLQSNDPNLPSAIEVLTQTGSTSIVAQRYLPEIIDGDKRIIVINGEPIDHVLARIPPAGQSRGNLAAGGKGVVQPISEHDREIARAVGRKLAPRGLALIGLDIIGKCLTEINVTSPTGFQEITAQAGIDVAAIFIDAVMPAQ
ncbi:glutathione synthase [beta proteobacterium MWH-UniP1]